MTSTSLARAYLDKARVRLEMLQFLRQRDAHSDVVPEAQELVELATKAMLRHVGIEPPKWHDVGPLLGEHAERFSEGVRSCLPEVMRISRDLRKERELGFYGDEAFIPTEQCGPDDADAALGYCRFVFETAEWAIAES